MKLLVINPNMTQAVTDAVAAAARRTASPGTEITGRIKLRKLNVGFRSDCDW